MIKAEREVCNRKEIEAPVEENLARSNWMLVNPSVEKPEEDIEGFLTVVYLLCTVN